MTYSQSVTILYERLFEFILGSTLRHVFSNLVAIKKLKLEKLNSPINHAIRFFRFELYHYDTLLNYDGNLEAFWMFLIEGFDENKENIANIWDCPDFGWEKIRKYRMGYYRGPLQWFDAKTGLEVDIYALPWDSIVGFIA